MRARKLSVVAVSFVLGLIAVGGIALAAMQVPTGNPIDDLCTIQAAGTKVYGTLTINFTNPTGASDLNFFLRLSKSNELYAYSGTASVTDISSPAQIKSAIDNFICTKVLPTLFNYQPADCSSVYALKSADVFVIDDPYHFPYGNGCAECVELHFYMLDVVLAVK